MPRTAWDAAALSLQGPQDRTEAEREGVTEAFCGQCTPDTAREPVSPGGAAPARPRVWGWQGAGRRLEDRQTLGSKMEPGPGVQSGGDLEGR